MEVLGLSNLAFVTCPDIPSNVVVEERPPESNKDIPSCRKSTFVSKVVMGVLDNS